MIFITGCYSLGFGFESLKWCKDLIAHSKAKQREGMMCDMFYRKKIIFDSAATSWTLDEFLQKAAYDDNRIPMFLGSAAQDLWVYHNHARFMTQPGVYIDLATNDPVIRSNTIFFDR